MRRETNAPYVHQLPFFRGELRLERRFRSLTGGNDLLFPSMLSLARRDWIGEADIWHFHNLHGHYISLPLLARESRRRHIVLSPVDQFLSTGYCPYTLGCARQDNGCGSCPQLSLPYPGISRDATAALLKIKKWSIAKSRFHILVHTDFLARHYHSTFVNARPISRLNYGVDTQIFRPMDRKLCASSLGLEPTSRFVVGIMHSNILEERKGFLSLLRLLAELAERVPNKLEILAVGHKSDQVLKLQTRNLRFQTLPFLESQEDLARALNLCDVLLYPTRAENLSLTCLNAMSCGVCVISADVGGQSEAIEDGINGYLCGPTDSKCFVDRLAELVRNPELHGRLSIAARRTVLERYDINTYIGKLILYYNRLLLGETA